MFEEKTDVVNSLFMSPVCMIFRLTCRQTERGEGGDKWKMEKERGGERERGREGETAGEARELELENFVLQR